MKVARLMIASLLIAACKGQKEAVPSRGEFSQAADQVAASPAPPPVAPSFAKVGAIGGAVAESDAAANQVQHDIKTTGAASAEQVAPSMLIRTGNASIEVDKLDPAMVRVRQLAAQLGGYIANSSLSGGRDQVRSATLELKIPAARYDQAVGGLGDVGKVESVNTNAEDVGEEYVDITARVANAKRLEERLVGLLAARTGRLQDVLAVERELARVREEIERYEGRMRFLRTRAAVSTLSVTLHEPFPILGRTPGENPIVLAIRQAWRNFVGFVAWTIASLGVLIPVAAILAALVLVFRRVRRRTTPV
jgi:hypothetical protein